MSDLEKKKKEKTPSKFKLWKQKMKATPKGRAYLKLIYWGIFFLFLFLFLGITSMITGNYEVPQNNQNSNVNQDEEEIEEVVVPKTLDELMDELINGTYEYTYDIHILDDEYLFEGKKYDTYQEGYKNYTTSLGSGVIRYYLDSTGTYQVNGSERVLITNFYEGMNETFFDFEQFFQMLNTLGFVRDENNTSYASYTCSDSNYQYMININPEGTSITDLSIVSIDGTITYLFTFTNFGDDADA